MKSAVMSNNALKRENASASANVQICKQWWKVCWMYGDQEKYYRQLYAKRAENVKVKCKLDEQNEPHCENLFGKSIPDITTATTSTVLGCLDLTNGIDE